MPFPVARLNGRRQPVRCLIGGLAVLAATAVLPAPVLAAGGLTPAWRAAIGTDGTSAPIYAGGRVFAGTPRGLVGLDPATGAIIIVNSTPVAGTPAVIRTSSSATPDPTSVAPQPDPDRIVFGSTDGVLHAVTSAGAPLWQVALGAVPASPLVLQGAASTIVVGAGRRVFALDGDGRRLWTTQLEGGDISKAAAVLTAPGEPERVIVSAGERVHALDAATGAVVWAVTPSGRPLSAPAIGDPHILVADDAGTLFSLDPRRGTVLSSFPGRGPVAIGDPNSSGPEVFVSDGGVFAQKEVDATPIWKAALGGQSGPLAVAGGVVLATPEPRDGAPRIVALDAATGRELGDAELPAGTSSAPALIGGRVVVATRRGDLVAYEGPDS